MVSHDLRDEWKVRKTHDLAWQVGPQTAVPAFRYDNDWWFAKHAQSIAQPALPALPHLLCPALAQKACYAEWILKCYQCKSAANHQMFWVKNMAAEGNAAIVTLMHCCCAVNTSEDIFC